MPVISVAMPHLQLVLGLLLIARARGLAVAQHDAVWQWEVAAGNNVAGSGVGPRSGTPTIDYIGQCANSSRCQQILG